MRRITTIVLSFLLAANAQQTPPSQQPQAATEGLATFTSNAQLVIEIVSVIDKSGKPIEGLTAKDFTVTENGAPQTIKFLEFQKLTDVPEAPLQFATRPDPNAPPAAWHHALRPRRHARAEAAQFARSSRMN